MAWQDLSLHFKQTYEGGYRYLDHCGEFMISASESLGFIAGETKPTGAQMEIPDQGISVTVDTVNLAVTQELPFEIPGEFVGLCERLADLVAEHVRPLKIVKNGFAWKSHWPFGNAESMLKASLAFGGSSHEELAKLVDMVAEAKELDHRFVSGSKHLHVSLQPVTFDRAKPPIRNANHRATRAEKTRVDRANRFIERWPSPLSNALLLVVDLMEEDPAADASLQDHFDELKGKVERMKKTFTTR